MSQKRDDRFATASEMRDAFRVASAQPLGEAATVLIAGAGGQANAGTVAPGRGTKLTGDRTSPLGSEAQTLVAADATNVRKSTSTSETATLIQSASRGKSSRTWLGAALLLLLVVGGAAGFYAYRARQQAHQNATSASENTAQPSQPNQAAPGQSANDSQVKSVQVDPAKATESKSEKKVDSGQRTASSKQSTNKAETSKPSQEQSGNPPSTAHDAERNRNPNAGPPPQGPPPQPPFDPRNPPGRQPGHPPGAGQMPEVRTLPNGTRIVIQPDGTRIITGPKGRVQVIPPGDKIPRKRNRP
jgi:hypothetical protein